MYRWIIICLAIIGCALYWFTKKSPSDRWDATYYKEHATGQFQGGLETLARYIFQGNEMVLDIGCGDGNLTAAIAARTPRGNVLGIDVSSNMITEARKNFGAIKNLSFRWVNAEEFISEDRYDLITSFSALHWITNIEKLFDHIATMLKPGGQLLARTTPKDEQSPASKLFVSDKWRALTASYRETFHGREAAEYEQLLAKTGFKNIDVTISPKVRIFANEQAFINHVMTWIPYATGLIDDKALEFAKDLAVATRDAMKEPSTDGHIEATTLTMVISAEKA